jgi:uncharacterized YigZ family protein
MRILTAAVPVELVVQRSRFLGLLEPVADAEAARSALKEAKARYADATHVVHAFRTGADGSETLGCSDDGEPPGTAGRPVLEVLKGAGGGNCLVLVVRWYGGTPLGTGGLVRAYGDTAKAVIAAATWEELREWVRATVTVEWSEHRTLRNELTGLGVKVEAETFGNGVSLTASIPAEVFDRVQTLTRDLSRGRSQWVRE